MRTLRYNASGQSLIGVLIAAALLGALSITMMKFSAITGKQQLQSTSAFQIDSISRQFSSQTRNATVWSKTLSDVGNAGASFACLVNHTDCAATASANPHGIAFRLVDGAGNLVMGYDPLTATNGLTSNGSVCTGFDSTAGSGNDTCPYHLDLKWKPTCPSSGTCIDPQVQVTGTFAYNPKTQQRTIAFNASNYNFQVMAGSGGSGSGGGSVDPSIVGGRLTLVSSDPNPSTDQTGRLTLYFTPYVHSKVALYDGTDWKLMSFSELSLPLSGSANSLYDIFLDYNGGAPQLVRGVAWAFDAARAELLSTQDGVLVKNSSPTKRYLGTIRLAAANSTDDTETKRFVWNYYNRVRRKLKVADPADNWIFPNLAAAAWRVANNNFDNKVEVVVGASGSLVTLSLMAVADANGAAWVSAAGAIGVNSAVPADDVRAFAQIPNGTMVPVHAHLTHTPRVGYSFYAWLEGAAAGNAPRFWGTHTWIPAANGAITTVSGLSGFLD